MKLENRQMGNLYSVNAYKCAIIVASNDNLVQDPWRHDIGTPQKMQHL